MTTTDRELLERAAKAAGIEIEFLQPSGQCFLKNAGAWNPIALDDDALRLANACGLSIEPYPYYDTPKHSVIVKQRRRSDQLRQSNPTEAVEVYGDDKDAATRRAIVRAAAIGKEMP